MEAVLTGLPPLASTPPTREKLHQKKNAKGFVKKNREQEWFCRKRGCFWNGRRLRWWGWVIIAIKIMEIIALSLHDCNDNNVMQSRDSEYLLLFWYQWWWWWYWWSTNFYQSLHFHQWWSDDFYFLIKSIFLLFFCISSITNMWRVVTKMKRRERGGKTLSRRQ